MLRNSNRQDKIKMLRDLQKGYPLHREASYRLPEIWVLHEEIWSSWDQGRRRVFTETQFEQYASENEYIPMIRVYICGPEMAPDEDSIDDHRYSPTNSGIA
jgi:hypothetical protein